MKTAYRKLLVVNVSEAFPLSWMEKLHTMEVYDKFMRRGCHYSCALVDSAARASALADLLTIEVRGSVLDSSPASWAGGMHDHKTIFHYLKSKGYFTTFLGSFGMYSAGSFDETMERLGLDAYSHNDWAHSSETGEMCDVQLLRQAHGVLSSWTAERSALFLSLRGVVDWDDHHRRAASSGDADAATRRGTKPSYDVDRYINIVDGLLCSLMELMHSGDHSDTVVCMCASHLVDDSGYCASAHGSHEMALHRSFLLVGGLDVQYGTVSRPCGLRQALHGVIEAATQGVDYVMAKDTHHHLAYKLCVGDLSGWHVTAPSVFDHDFMHVAMWMESGDENYWCTFVFSLRMLVAATYSVEWDRLSLGERLQLLYDGKQWTIPTISVEVSDRIRVHRVDVVENTSEAVAVQSFDNLIPSMNDLLEELAQVDVAFAQSDLAPLLYETFVSRKCRHVIAARTTTLVDSQGHELTTLLGTFDAAQLSRMSHASVSLVTHRDEPMPLRFVDGCVLVDKWQLDLRTYAFVDPCTCIVTATTTKVATADPAEESVTKPTKITFRAPERRTVEHAVLPAASHDTRPVKPPVSNLGAAKRIEQRRRSMRDLR